MKTIVFGTGKVAKDLMKYGNELRIAYFIDNDVEKQRQGFEGKAVKSVDYIKKDKDYDYIIIASSKYLSEMQKELYGYAVPENKIIIYRPGDYERGAYSDVAIQKALPKGMLRKNIVPFKKEKLIIDCPFFGETFKARERRIREGFFEKYCKGEGLDIGYGNDIVLPECYGWDIANGDAQYLEGIEDESFHYVHSSHCLEHMVDVRISLKNWFRVCKTGGYLLLLIPHRDLYEKKTALPSRWNADHKHMFLIGKKEAPDTLDIVEEIREALVEHYRIIYVKECSEGWSIPEPDLHSNGEYSIEIVVQKI